MMKPKQRNLWWVVLAAFAIALLTVAVVDRGSAPVNNRERALSLGSQFACPVCEGQSIAESNVPIAREIRKEIVTRLDQGQTDEQIREYLVGLYGDNINLLPKASGVTGMVWFLPVFAFVLALAGLIAVFRRWRNEVPTSASDADRVLVNAALGRNDEAASTNGTSGGADD